MDYYKIKQLTGLCNVTNFPIFVTLLVVIAVDASLVYISLFCTLRVSASSLAQTEITQAK